MSERYHWDVKTLLKRGDCQDSVVHGRVALMGADCSLRAVTKSGHAVNQSVLLPGWTETLAINVDGALFRLGLGANFVGGRTLKSGDYYPPYMVRMVSRRHQDAEVLSHVTRDTSQPNVLVTSRLCKMANEIARRSDVSTLGSLGLVGHGMTTAACVEVVADTFRSSGTAVRAVGIDGANGALQIGGVGSSIFIVGALDHAAMPSVVDTLRGAFHGPAG